MPYLLTTPAELVSAGAWETWCDLVNMNPHAVSSGTMGEHQPVVLTVALGRELGLLPAPDRYPVTARPRLRGSEDNRL